MEDGVGEEGEATRARGRAVALGGGGDAEALVVNLVCTGRRRCSEKERRAAVGVGV